MNFPITPVAFCRHLLFLFSALWSVSTLAEDVDVYAFTPADVVFLKSFSLSSLPPLPSAPSNKYADDDQAAVLGRALFFDKRFSKRGKFSCASCHQPEKYFTDGLAIAEATGKSHRSTPTLIGAAWSPWQYWDGRKDSLWSQALEPIEHPAEMNMDRASFARKLLKYYEEDYKGIFGELKTSKRFKRFSKNASPNGTKKQKKRWEKLSNAERDQINEVFTNAGKAMMAYQRKLTLHRSRFDKFVDALAAGTPNKALLNPQEARGMRLFMGKANCASCHNGPFFTNYEFHNIGAPEPDQQAVDLGRYTGVEKLASEEFTCLSSWSDAGPNDCEEMQFLKRTGPELVGAFKTPTLRNIFETAPYMQAGQFKDLVEVINHYNVPKPPFYDREQHPNRPHFDILPLKLDEREIEDIILFLASLTSPYPEDDFWWNINIKE